MNVIDVIAIALIVLVLCVRRGTSTDLVKHTRRLESLGYSSVPLMLTDDYFSRAYKHYKFWTGALRVLLIGYAGSWVVTLLS